MKQQRPSILRLIHPCWLLSPCLLALSALPAHASIAYGSINNFDTVNDTGRECHGFEIEIEDCRSIDVTYTYDYNHYGTPVITQDDSLPNHPKCIIRWQGKKNPDGSWSAYTAIPSGPIAPTDGHMFTDPTVNFGGEHFGVGYSTAVGAIRYQWLVDDGAGNLIHGGAVQVSTPSFSYFPPVDNVPAQVQAVIQPPPPPPEAPENPNLEFGTAVWVKEIRTTSHNNQKVELRDLVSDDPNDPNDTNWRHGEEDEVEVEWQLLQKELSKPDGGNNGQLVAAPDILQQGDEVVTRRYEFFEYAGPLDANGEAKASSVGPDGVHGKGIKTINGEEVDLATVVVVGAYKGAQMSAIDVDGAAGLVDHVSDGEVGVPYTERRLVVEGPLPFTASRDGALPTGMTFEPLSGILSGTPDQSGRFPFSVTVNDGTNPPVTKSYVLNVAQTGLPPNPAVTIDAQTDPAGAGSISGSGSFAPGDSVVVQATPTPGYRFVEWLESGSSLTTSDTFSFVAGDVNRTLTARFVELDQPTPIAISPSVTPGNVFSLEWSLVPGGWILQESPDLSPGSWIDSVRDDTPHDGLHHIEIPVPAPTQRFFRLYHLPVPPAN